MKSINSSIEKQRMLEIFKTAFADAPGVLWMTGKNERKLDYVMRYFIEEARVKNGAYLTSDHAGAVLYFHLQNKKQSLALILRKLHLFLFVLGIKKGIQSMRYKKLVKSIRPRFGWLGWFVATDQDGEGIKAAYEIKQEMFRIADEANEPIYVETTVPRVRLLYLRAGYTEYKAVQHPFEDLTIWFLKREPSQNFIR